MPIILDYVVPEFEAQSILIQDILDRVTDLLLDKDRGDDDARWSDDELVRWINDARLAVLNRRPVACSKVATMGLAAGTYQAIPVDGTQLLDVIRNIAADGVTPGRSVRRTDRQNIDDHDLDWHAAPASATISQFTYDDRTPRAFYVIPPAIEGVKVQIAYVAIPQEVTAQSTNLNLPPEYIEAVVNYVAYRAKSKDSEYANAAEAAAFYGAFNDALGVTQQGQSANSPNQPGNSV